MTRLNEGGDLPQAPLSQHIRLFAELLEEVIIEQAGRPTYQLEETIRLLSKSFREGSASEKSLDDILSIIRHLSPRDRLFVTKANSLLLQLIGVAEERYYVVESINEKLEDRREDTLRESIRYAKTMGLRSSDVISILNSLNVRLVFSPHPTEAMRISTKMHLRAIYELLEHLDTPGLGALLEDRYREEIKYHLTLLWQSEELRGGKVSQLDQVRNLLYYFEYSLFDTLPVINDNLRRIIVREYQDDEESVRRIDFRIPRFFTFGSTVGSTLSAGNTAKTAYETALLQKRLCLRKYLQIVDKLLKHLSISVEIVDVSKELLMSIEADSKLFPDFTKQTRPLNQNEPYRKKLDYIRVKLLNTLSELGSTAEKFGIGRTLVGRSPKIDQGPGYIRSIEFLQDLKVIQNSLKKHRGKLVSNGLLRQLIDQVRIFGFHLAPLDFIHPAGAVKDTVREILLKIGYPNQLLEGDEQLKTSVQQELGTSRPLGIQSILPALSPTARELILAVLTAEKIAKSISPRAVGSFVITQCTGVTEVLSLLLLLKDLGLTNYGFVSNPIFDISVGPSPSINSEQTVALFSELFREEAYLKHLQSRGYLQEVYIDYGHMNVSTGFLPGCERGYQMIEHLIPLFGRHDVRLRVYHGVAGSISRGGRASNKAVLSLPIRSSINMKLMQEGELLSSLFANQILAYRNLERIVNAAIIRGIQDKYLIGSHNPSHITEESRKQFSELSQLVSSRYTSMLQSMSLQFIEKGLPIDLIRRIRIGPAEHFTISSNVPVDPITWRLCWILIRNPFSSYYGVGSALNEFRGKHGLDELQSLYNRHRYFREVIDYIDLILQKVDLEITEVYCQVTGCDPQFHSLLEDMRREYDLTKEMILQVKQTSELLEDLKLVKFALNWRLPYLDPLTFLQIAMLKQWRKERQNRENDDLFLPALRLAVNRIVSALKNVG